MRVRNIKGASEMLAANKNVLNDYTSLKGKFLKHFKKSKLSLEIGCGKGHYFLEMAKQHPDTLFVAIEKNPSIAYLASKLSLEYDLDNICLINVDAEKLLEIFEIGEVDAIYLNFSDPWPKKRYAKRRLSHGNFLKNYQLVLSEAGEIIQKTDNYDLFLYSVNTFLKTGYVLTSIDTNFDSEKHGDVMSGYERKFVAKGHPIYRMIIRKDENNVK